MRIALVTVLCALVLTASSGIGTRADDKAEVEKELNKFKGAWTFESVIAGNKQEPAARYDGMTVTFEGDKFTVKKGDEVIQVGTQKLDPSKSPKTLDVTVAEGLHKGAVMPGIYEISGDTLKVCFDPEGKKRPTEFKGASGSQVYVVHKRVKSDLPKKPPRKGIDADTVKAYQKLGGRYGGWLKGPNEIWDFQPLPEIAERGVPGFKFNGFPTHVKFPEVDVPFGLEIPHARDEGLKNLAHLSTLIQLHLGSGVSDAGLKELAPLTGLKELYLTRDQITDAGLKHLAPLKNLTVLDLFYSGVTGPGLKDLAPLQELKELNLRGCKVTDAGLKNLPPLKNLSFLSLMDTRVTDAGLKELAALPSLTHLDLSGIKITDNGLKELAVLKNLKYLQLQGTDVSDKAVRELHKALPRCNIAGPR